MISCKQYNVEINRLKVDLNNNTVISLGLAQTDHIKRLPLNYYYYDNDKELETSKLQWKPLNVITVVNVIIWLMESKWPAPK